MSVCCDLLFCVGSNAAELGRSAKMALAQDADLLKPDVDSTIVAAMKLLQRVTLNYGIASKVRPKSN